MRLRVWYGLWVGGEFRNAEFSEGFGNGSACLARFRLHAAGVVGALVFLIKFQGRPTTDMLGSLAEAPKANQFPKIPFIPRSCSHRSLLNQRSEVSSLLGGGQGVIPKRRSDSCASSLPCSAAFLYQAMASHSSFGTPSPSRYMLPRWF